MARVFSKKEKDYIVKTARDEVAKCQHAEAAVAAGHGACLYLSHFIAADLMFRGRRPMMQAGNAIWRRLPADQDDGTVSTHFGYEWQGGDSAIDRASIAAGHLPEMHVWLVDAMTGELIDASTNSFPVACKAITGADWIAPKPPNYFWSKHMHKDAQYVPIKEAMNVSYRALWSLFQPSYLVPPHISGIKI